MPLWYDQYYLLLVVPAMLIALFARWNVNNTFARYQQVQSYRGLTGAEVARQILDNSGLRDVEVLRVAGSLTDHFDPRSNTVSLSESVYDNASVASIGVAAHEVGHAIQYAEGYVPIRVRNLIIPVTQLGSTLAIPLVILGVVSSIEPLVTIGALLFTAVVFFQLITLPVEFNASRRALEAIRSSHILEEGEELTGARRTLRAAALTYVAALVVALAHLLRLLAISRRRR